MPERREILGTVLDSLASGVIAIDRAGDIVVFNSAASRLLGYPKEGALGKNLLAIVPNAGLVNVLRTGKPEVGRPQTIGTRTVLTNRSPIFRDGGLIGAASIFQDITETEKVSRELDSTKTIVRTLEEVLAGAEAMMKFVDYNITWMHTAGRERQRTGRFDPAVFPYTYIRCKDGYTFIAAYNNEAFESLMHIIGRPELANDRRFCTGPDRTRIENEKVLHAILEEWSGSRTADEILREIEEYTSKKSGHGAAVVTGRVNRPLETLSEENWWERGCFSRVAGTVYGDLLLAAPPWKMSGTPPRIRSVCRKPGADNDEVYSTRLGMTGEEILSLHSRGVL